MLPNGDARVKWEVDQTYSVVMQKDLQFELSKAVEDIPTKLDFEIATGCSATSVHDDESALPESIPYTAGKNVEEHSEG